MTSTPRTTSRPAADTAFARRSLLGIAAVGSVLFVAAYVVSVRTSWGQRLDAAALRGRRVLSARDIHVAQRVHTTIEIAAILLFGSAILLVALLRGRRRLAVGVATIIVGSTFTAEVLKRVLARPALVHGAPLKQAATFPSGHTTIAMALGVGAMLVAPRRLRGVCATVGVVFTAMVACSLVMTASHRPSDTIGSVLLVTVWTALVATALIHSTTAPARPRPAWARVSPWMALTGACLLVAAFLGTVIVAVAIHRGRLDTVELGRAFATAASAIVGATALCTAALLAALHHVDLDKPARIERRTEQSLVGAVPFSAG